VLRDPRWGRAEECYGEDPYLAAELTAAITEGFQASGKIAVILKHFAAQGEPIGGHNSGPVSIGVRELREIFLDPMRAGIRSGALGVMAAYNEIDGVP
ncbi:beta-glucosidase, partial [Listeria monocytogenes]|nr:beta-glucosidase [Listeria monocytogenes]